jgi:xanthine dehydrogenase molybdopterin-binding subunit B
MFPKNSVSFRGYESDMNWEKGEGHPFEYSVYGAACSEVEIDCLTGSHKVSTTGKVFKCTYDAPRIYTCHLLEEI